MKEWCGYLWQMSEWIAWPLCWLVFSVFSVSPSGYYASWLVSLDVQLFFPLNTQHVFHLVFFSEWNFNQRPLHSSDRESLEKITRCNGKENNALSTEMENTKIIICKKQVMHMLKCQEAADKLIAFCHKHSLINMITFAYFILLLICCLGDSCSSSAHASERRKKKRFHYCSETKQVFWVSLGLQLFTLWQKSNQKKPDENQ